jgi:hypothetical protein
MVVVPATASSKKAISYQLSAFSFQLSAFSFQPEKETATGDLAASQRLLADG